MNGAQIKNVQDQIDVVTMELHDGNGLRVAGFETTNINLLDYLLQFAF